MSAFSRVLHRFRSQTGQDAAAPNRDSSRSLPQLPDQETNELKNLITSRPHWYQAWQITEEVRLPGHVVVDDSLDAFGVPDNLSGAKILDVGTCNGAFAFEFERRGAEVVAVDICLPDHYGFESLARILQSRVRYLQATVYDLDTRFSPEEFDYVFFSGVIYHLRHPPLALDKLHKITKQALWLESYVIDNQLIVDGNSQKLPAELCGANLMQFYRRGELANDPSNFFGPSISCLESMLWSCGFKPTLKHASEDRALFYAEKLAGPPEHERLLMSEHPSYYYEEGPQVPRN